EVFKTIASQSQYKFLYNDEVLTKSPRVSLTVRNASLNDVLKKLLSDDLYEYKIMANTVLISLANPKLVTISDVQTRASGTVLDGEGNPLGNVRSEEHTSELQSRENLVCR